MIDPSGMYYKALAQAEVWADCDHAAGVLEDALSALEGVIIAELKASGEPVSVVNKLAKSDSRYKEAAKTWRDAKKEALIARLKYDQMNRFQDNVRTKESTERQLAR